MASGLVSTLDNRFLLTICLIGKLTKCSAVINALHWMASRRETWKERAQMSSDTREEQFMDVWLERRGKRQSNFNANTRADRRTSTNDASCWTSGLHRMIFNEHICILVLPETHDEVLRTILFHPLLIDARNP